MRLRIIGSAGPYPGAGRPTSCYLLEAEGRRLILDLGSGALAALARVMDVTAADALCLSHTHWDHCCDVLPLQYALARAGRSPELFLPPEERGGRMEGLLAAGYSLRYYESAGELAGLRYRTVLTQHPVPNRAIRLEAEGKSFLYTGDAARSRELLSLGEKVDVMLADAAFLSSERPQNAPHMSAAEAAELARTCGAGKLILTHLPPHTPEEALLEEACKVFPNTFLSLPGCVFEW